MMDTSPIEVGLMSIGVVGLIWVALAIAFNVLLVVLVVLGIRWLMHANRNAETVSGTSRGAAAADDAAISALRERFARGEIDEEEFNRRRRVLNG